MYDTENAFSWPEDSDWDRDEIRQRFRYNCDPQFDGEMAIDGV
jgi:hypothetical protein